MPTPPAIALPSYLDQAPEVAARFQALKQREVILNVRDLTKTFDSPKGEVTVLKQINFQAHRREFLCVIGPSGCGKSTLIRILAGLESPSGGAVLLDDQAIQGPGPDRGMVFQAYTLFPWLTVKKNVMFGLDMAASGAPSVEQEALQWIDLVGLSKFSEAYPYQLSGGMKQRVAIARALATCPRILLMDEPFSALDAQTRGRMQSHLLEIWKNVNITIVFITHDLDEAIYLADRILVLKANPGEVHEMIEVPVPRPRSVTQLIGPEFLATKKRLEELIHGEKKETEEETFKMIRMTEVGDDVE